MAREFKKEASQVVSSAYKMLVSKFSRNGLLLLSNTAFRAVLYEQALCPSLLSASFDVSDGKQFVLAVANEVDEFCRQVRGNS